MSGLPTPLVYKCDEYLEAATAVSNRTSMFIIPSATTTKINKEECIFSCDTPESPSGLFINLLSYSTVGYDYLVKESLRTGAQIFLQIKAEWMKKGPVEEPTKMGIGIEGGFEADQSKLIKQVSYYLYSISDGLILPLQKNSAEGKKEEWSILSLEGCGFSNDLACCMKSIIDSSGVTISGNTTTWEEEIKESRYAQSLQQIANPPTIPSCAWKCDLCGKTTNLWMNLYDGYIGCGRKLYGMKDSGCLGDRQGAAVLHHEENPTQRPLAVKLGTITPTSADVYSYIEDSMVYDPWIAEHLFHFGIPIQKTEKSEKTLSELQIDLNKNHDWSQMTEADVQLEIATGPGHIGIRNFGNSCYINSVLQALSHIDELYQVLSYLYAALLNGMKPNSRPSEDLLLQFAKVLVGLSSDRYPKQRHELIATMNEEIRSLYLLNHPNEIIAPKLFRHVSTAKHPEFSTSRQQDAEEFLRYFLEKLETTLQKTPSLEGLVPGTSTLISSLFEFQIEEQLRPNDSPSQVKISYVPEKVLSLPLPDFTAEVQQNKKQRSSGESSPDLTVTKHFEDCLNGWASGENVGLYKKSEDGTLKCIQARKTRKFKTFPPYLFIQLRRFYLGPDWTAQKLVFPINVPSDIDLSKYRATGMEEKDVEWPDSDTEGTPADSLSPIDESSIDQIMAMGFTRNAALRSMQGTQTSAVESCLEWMMSHMEDPDLNDPIPEHHQTSKKKKTHPQLEDMGFNPLQIEAALLENEDNVNRAMEWIFTVGSELSELDLQCLIEKKRVKAVEKKVVEPDGTGVYKILGIISHMGASAHSGHYVYHFYSHRTNEWIVFNDERVAKSQHPPLNLGYIYLFKRVR